MLLGKVAQVTRAPRDADAIQVLAIRDRILARGLKPLADLAEGRTLTAGQTLPQRGLQAAVHVGV